MLIIYILAKAPKNKEPESPKNIFLFLEKLPIKTGTKEESIIIDRNNKLDVFFEKNSKLTNKIKCINYRHYNKDREYLRKHAI